MRFFLFCFVVFFVAGCQTNNFQHHEMLLNFMINQSASHNEYNIDSGVRQCVIEFFATYFTEEELQDFVDVTSKTRYRDLQQEMCKKQTAKQQQELAEFIRENSKTDFFKKINSVDFKKQYKKHLDTYIMTNIK